jgi:hypothetical protein
MKLLFIATAVENLSHLISDIDENLASDFDGSLSGETRNTICDLSNEVFFNLSWFAATLIG